MELVNVYSTRGELDAEVIKSILNSQGIPAMIKGKTQGSSLSGLNWNASFGSVEVLVSPLTINYWCSASNAAGRGDPSPLVTVTVSGGL